MKGIIFWDTEIYLLPFLTYTSPDRQESADLPLADAAAGTSARQAINIAAPCSRGAPLAGKKPRPTSCRRHRPVPH